MATVRETIRRITQKHLDGGNIVAGQCLTAVGNVGGTLPDDDRLTELSMADVAGGGFICGMGLAGKRPIYVIRYQGFCWYNIPMIVNYAAKAKTFGFKCPVMVRAIAMEGAIGPVAGSSHHSLVYRMPGIKVVSPMSPEEYEQVYEDFMFGDDVMFVSEHRGSYDNDLEFLNVLNENPLVTIMPISVTRFTADKVAQILSGKCDIIHQVKIGQDHLTDEAIGSVERSRRVLILDDDYENGIGKCLSHDIQEKFRDHDLKIKVSVLGLPNRTAGFSSKVDVLPPSVEDVIATIGEL